MAKKQTGTKEVRVVLGGMDIYGNQFHGKTDGNVPVKNLPTHIRECIIDGMTSMVAKYPHIAGVEVQVQEKNNKKIDIQGFNAIYTEGATTVSFCPNDIDMVSSELNYLPKKLRVEGFTVELPAPYVKPELIAHTEEPNAEQEQMELAVEAEPVIPEKAETPVVDEATPVVDTPVVEPQTKQEEAVQVDQMTMIMEQMKQMQQMMATMQNTLANKDQVIADLQAQLVVAAAPITVETTVVEEPKAEEAPVVDPNRPSIQELFDGVTKKYTERAIKAGIAADKVNEVYKDEMAAELQDLLMKHGYTAAEFDAFKANLKPVTKPEPVYVLKPFNHSVWMKYEKDPEFIAMVKQLDEYRNCTLTAVQGVLNTKSKTPEGKAWVTKFNGEFIDRFEMKAMFQTYFLEVHQWSDVVCGWKSSIAYTTDGVRVLGDLLKWTCYTIAKGFVWTGNISHKGLHATADYTDKKAGIYDPHRDNKWYELVSAESHLTKVKDPVKKAQVKAEPRLV